MTTTDYVSEFVSDDRRSAALRAMIRSMGPYEFVKEALSTAAIAADDGAEYWDDHGGKDSAAMFRRDARVFRDMLSRLVMHFD